MNNTPPILIVGFGIAGANLAYTLQQRGIAFNVIDKHREVTSSKVAAGLYNPVTGRRAVKTWMADELFPFARTFYSAIETELSLTLQHHRPGYRIFKEEKDQRKMARKVENPDYAGYLNTSFDQAPFTPLVHNENGGIEILQSGNLDISTYLDAYKAKLISKGDFTEENFEHSEIRHKKNSVEYKGVSYSTVIFCEGFRAMDNPYFSWLPFALTKGEMLKIKCNLPQSHIVNKGFFILPQGGNTFLVGSSYERVLDESITQKGRTIVSEKLDALLTIPYKIIGHYGALRPTVLDRHPFLGRHPKFSNIAIFNGMGTKGVTLSPYFAKVFVDYLKQDTPLLPDVAIERYRDLYDTSQEKF